MKDFIVIIVNQIIINVIQLVKHAKKKEIIQSIIALNAKMNIQ